MRFIFYTSISFEDWDYDNSVKKGIGGSETSIVEMSWRLARRGHEVIVYAPIKKTTKRDWRGTKWYRFEKADFKLPGVWILYRVPEAVDKFLPRRKNQKVWLLWQDWDYPTLTKKRMNGVDQHITLSKSHGKYMTERYPGIKVWLSSNGLKLDLIESIEREKITRNPKRLMYASSPDRGLKQALISFKKAREFDSDLEFHAFYGFNNLRKLSKGNPQFKKVITDIEELLDQPGVTFHGRINQRQLMREWFKSGIYVYETNFFETSHISGMEAMACGAVPIFSPVYAQGENIKHGIGIEGDANDSLTNSRFAHWIVKMTKHPELQELIRPEAIKYARERFNWERFVYQWELEALDRREIFEKAYDYPEQLIPAEVNKVIKIIKEKHKELNSQFNFKEKPFEKYVQQLSDVKGKTVLDVGGYDGKQSDWALGQGAKSATVVDNNSWKIYQDWPEFKPFKNVRYIDLDIFDYNTPADVVICQNVIYHVRNPWLLVEKLRKLTKKTLILSTSYVEGRQQKWDIYRPYEGHPVSWTVAWRPTISGLKALLEANGFKVVDQKIAKGHIVVKCIPVKPPIGFNYET